MIRHKMKINNKVLALSFFFILLLSACGNTEKAQELTKTSNPPVITQPPEPTSSSTLNPPTQTPTITLTPTEAITATPTLDVPGITLAGYDFLYNKSSLFSFDLNYSSGEYYGTGRLQDGTLLNYSCWFRDDLPTRIVCTGGIVPFDSKINFQLYRKDTDEVLYNNVFVYNTRLHGEILATPTGVTCEVEPQWGGIGPAHQLDIGCFAMSCWQNGEYLWGTDNTCRDPWPYEWDFVHPLYTPDP